MSAVRLIWERFRSSSVSYLIALINYSECHSQIAAFISMDFGEGRCSAYGSLRCKKGPRQRDGHSDAAGNHNTDEGSECFHHLLHAHTKSSFNFTLNTTNALSTQYTTDLTKSSLTNTTNSSRSLDPHSIRPSCLSSKRVSHLHLLRRRSLTLRRFRLPQGGRRPRRIPCSPRDA